MRTMLGKSEASTNERVNSPFMMNWVSFWALTQPAHQFRWWSLPQLQLLVRQPSCPQRTPPFAHFSNVDRFFLPVLLISTAVILQPSLFQQNLFQQEGGSC